MSFRALQEGFSAYVSFGTDLDAISKMLGKLLSMEGNINVFAIVFIVFATRCWQHISEEDPSIKISKLAIVL